MAIFVFLTPTSSIAAEYFRKVLHKEKNHRLVIVPSVEEAHRLHPDFVMVTVYDEYNEYILAKAWSEEIKRALPSTKLILGGPAFRSRPVAFFKNLNADYALRGEVDFTFQLLVDEITKERPDPEKLRQIPGIMFFEKGRLFMNQEYPSLSQDQLEALDFQHYCSYESDDMVSVFTERGCPYTCTYCSRVFGRTMRSLSVDRIMEILREVSLNTQIKRVMFVNDNMVYSMGRAKRFFRKIIEEKWNERFEFLIQARIDNFISDDKKYLPHGINIDLINLIKKAGVVKISFGTESFNDAEIKRLKPEARYSGIDAMRLTRELGKKGMRVVHFLLEPGPDALPEETIESTYRRLVVMRSYSDYIEISKIFANPAKIILIRGSGLYNRALSQDFQVTELNDPQREAVDILNVERIEQQSISQTAGNVYLPFLNPVNRFGTSSNPYRNLLFLEEELEALQRKQQHSDEEQKRFERLRKKIKTYRIQVNRINEMIKRTNDETKMQLGEMLGEFGGIGRFLQEYERLPIEIKREKLVELTKQFDQASLEEAPRNVLEADTRLMFFVYVANAVKELVSNPQRTKQVIKRYKRLTRNEIINKMIRLRANTPLHIYTEFSEKDLPMDRPAIGILKNQIRRDSAIL